MIPIDRRQFIKDVYRFIQKTYEAEVQEDSTLRFFWKRYFQDHFSLNPKFFKFTGTVRKNGGIYILSTTLPRALFMKLSSAEKPDQVRALHKQAFEGIIRLCTVNLYQKKARLPFFPIVHDVFVDNKSIDTEKSMSTEYNPETSYGVIMEKIGGKNFFELFQKDPNTCPPELTLLPSILGKIGTLKLPESVRYPDSAVDRYINKAKSGLIFLSRYTSPHGPVFKDLETFVHSLQRDFFHESQDGVLFTDCTPINFIVEGKSLRVVDLETMGNYYPSFSHGHHAAYFLTHLPYSNIPAVRKHIIEHAMKRASDQDKFKKALLLSFIAHSSDVISYYRRRMNGALFRSLVETNRKAWQNLIKTGDIVNALGT